MFSELNINNRIFAYVLIQFCQTMFPCKLSKYVTLIAQTFLTTQLCIPALDIIQRNSGLIIINTYAQYYGGK